MKRRAFLWLLAGLLLLTQPGAVVINSYNRGPAAGGGSAFVLQGSGNSLLANTVQLTNVAAGELIVLWIKTEGGAPPVLTGVSDGTALTIGTVSADAGTDLYGIFAWKLASTATGTVTYTASYTGTAEFQSMIAHRFSYGGTASLDTQIATAAGASASPSVNSGNITTSAGAGLGLVISGWGQYNANTTSSMTIDGVSATAIPASQATSGSAWSWHRVGTGTFTNQSACNNSAAVNYVNNLIAFKTQ